MNDRFDLNKLLKFARENAVSLNINYWEASDELEVEVLSAAKNEFFYMKRCPSVEYFIEKWNEKLNEK